MCSNKEKEILLHILQRYKDMPCLWKKDHIDYMNKDVRAQGFNELLEIYKKVDDEATVKILKKKIENMRTNYCKELKKVIASKHAAAEDNEVYVPSLWYFNALSFLGNGAESCYTVPDSQDDETLLSDCDNVSLPTSTKSFKRRRNESHIEKQGHIIEPSFPLAENYTQKEEQWEVFGRSIGYQMKDIDDNQLVICQKLISDAIFYAKTYKLNENSRIVNPDNAPAT